MGVPGIEKSRQVGEEFGSRWAGLQDCGWEEWERYKFPLRSWGGDIGPALRGTPLLPVPILYH